LDDCSTPALPFLGSDPAVADTDEDGINDGDEFLGTTTGIDLPTMGANPLRKNIFIEADWVQHPGNPNDYNRPDPSQLDRVQVAFAASPVANHCWGTGVTVLIDYGQSGPFFEGNQVADPTGDGFVNTTSPGVNDEFQAIKTTEFGLNRQGYFHYMLMCNDMGLGGTIAGWSGISEIGGNDFIVSCGAFAFGDDDRIGNTIMHELGHNLGLLHGGFESRNYKPNYNSVMNYRFQFDGVDTDCDAVSDGSTPGITNVLDYSRGLRIELNENALSEAAGVCGDTAIDWNGGGIQGGTVGRNINGPAGFTAICGEGGPSMQCPAFPGSCDDCVCDVLLEDNNDWSSIIFTGLTEADFAPPEIAICDTPRPASRKR
jgi:hypothetical protein